MSAPQQNTDRLDRIEQTLDNLTRANEQSNKRLDRAHEDAAQHLKATNQTLARLAELLTRSHQQTNERMDRAEKLIADTARNVAFMQAQMKGHISQPVPPAHPTPNQD